nr:odorant receptor 22 [Papilio glaucus]
MYSSFDAFKPHFNALARVGYFKTVFKSSSKIKQTLNMFYRTVVWFLVILYNFQHVLRVVRHSTEEIVNTLFILLTTLNTLGKQVAFNVRTARIDRIINTINGSLFASCNEYHDDIMKRNAAAMRRLLRSYHCAIFLCAIMWTIYPVVNRILGEDVHFSGYFPYDTSQPPVFALTVAYMSILITLQAYGNVTMDCTIVAFYAQAKTQLQMLRYDLKHLADAEDGTNNARKLIKRTYKHVESTRCGQLLHNRFVKCIKHHQLILWFVKEIESIFGEAMVVQFFVMAWVICMTVYKIVGLAVLSAEFCSMAIYLGCMLAQLFIYCYYGTQLKYESECINQSIYECEWMSLSPAMRRQLLVLMVRSSRPLAPCIAYIVPMSIETYISILKSSYTLFTFLDRK